MSTNSNKAVDSNLLAANYGYFVDRIAVYFDLDEKPDGSAVRLTLKDGIKACDTSGWNKAIAELGYAWYGDDGTAIEDTREDSFIINLEEYFNDNPMGIDEVRYGLYVLEILNRNLHTQ